MFGLLRYFFAIAVVCSHLYLHTPSGPAAYAVWGFYCLSGYLMALNLDRKYPLTRDGLAEFAISRLFRLMPAYLAVLAASAAVFESLPATSAALIGGLRAPNSAYGWVITFLPVWPSIGGRSLVPQFYAVRIEVIFYAAMALGLARDRRVVVAWFVGSLAIAARLILDGAGFETRYATVGAASLPFSVGALVYFFGGHLPRFRGGWSLAVAFGIWAVHCLVMCQIPAQALDGVGMYTGLAASAATICLLKDVDVSGFPAWVSRLDKLGGDLSYGLYLSHWAVAVAVSAAIGGRGRGSMILLLVSLVVTHVAAFLLLRRVEGPAEGLKRRLLAARRELDPGGRTPSDAPGISIRCPVRTASAPRGSSAPPPGTRGAHA